MSQWKFPRQLSKNCLQSPDFPFLPQKFPYISAPDALSAFPTIAALVWKRPACRLAAPARCARLLLASSFSPPAALRGFLIEIDSPKTFRIAAGSIFPSIDKLAYQSARQTPQARRKWPRAKAKRTGFTATWRAFFARLGLAHDRAKRGEIGGRFSTGGGWFSRPPTGGLDRYLLACTT